MIKLRKILLSNKLYYLLLLLTIIYVFLYVNTYRINDIFKINDNEFILKVKNYKIDGDKLNIEFNNLTSVYYFKSENEKNNLKLNINDEIYLKGKLNIPNNNTIPGTFNYKKYLYYKRINYILNIDSFKIIRKNNNIFYKLKNFIINRISSINNNEYLYAFILGKSNYIDNDVYNNYKINGITHLFALSGLHVSMFSSILLVLFKKLKFSEKKSYLITSIFLMFFSFIASFTPSILRATIFFILSALNNVYYFYIKPKNLLYLTFIILIFINPFYIYDTGFILSFTITFFILLFNEKNSIKNKILSIITISILSLLSSLPIIINLSYEINIIGFINNIFFIPFVSYIVFPMSIITLIFNKLSFLLNIFTSIMEFISKISSNFLNINLIFSKMNLFEIIIYYIIFILLIKYRKRIFYLIFIDYIILLYNVLNIDKKNYVYFIDVGQGDSALIKTQNNKTILIDTGGKINYKVEKWKVRNKEFNLMTSNIILFFKSIGIKKIDYLLLSHGDEDHSGYALELINNFKVKNVIFNCGFYNELEKKIINKLIENNIDYSKCIDKLDIDNNKVYFLNTKDFNNENDNSSVIYTKIDNYNLLFMGDASITTENEILSKYKLSDIDIFKVGHHGSNTSSSKQFIDKIKPKYSIISVGNNNRYGHPNKEVLDNLGNSKIYRTDIDGSVMFKIKNNKLKIETCNP